ncbi:caspase family protein [Bariatricus sp. HCP28S3_E4]|uniref:caspase family protein n=1 Tax=unclassified Bariatricus TaxID=2677046 RepID=UPI003F89954A
MNRYAILIGCEEYTNFSDICFCHADVELVRSTLIEYCDYNDKNTETIVQYKGCDETPEVIYEKLEEIIERAEQEDTVLFYFAGHGAKEEDKGYLLLADSSAKDYGMTALNLGTINKILRNPKVNGIIILDACHSGINARNTFTPLVMDKMNDTGCITLASCSENQESNPYPEQGQGVFTYYLCEEIKNTEPGTPIYIEQLKFKVCNSVEKWAEENCKAQTPTLNGQSVGNVSIAIRNKKEYNNNFYQFENQSSNNSYKEVIVGNISKSLKLFATNVEVLLNDSVSVTTDTPNQIQPEERFSLFYPIMMSWLSTQGDMSEVNIMEADLEWRAFGEFFVYMAKDTDEKQWIVMLNILKKMNYSSVIHAIKNLREVRKYYEKFGKEYKYHQVILISKGREEELIKTINTHTKIKRMYDDRGIKNSVVYLQDGKFVKIMDNYS